MIERDEAPNGDAPLFARFTVDNLSDAVYWVRKDASIAYANQAASEMLGYNRQELEAMYIYQLNPAAPKDTWPKIWDLLEAKGRRTFETTHLAKDGRSIPVEVVANVLMVGDQSYSCAFTRDISERKALEERLRQSQKMEAVGRLAGGVAHDFNNQLAGMMGYAELLKLQHGEDPESVRLLDKILAGIGRASDLTRDLLTFSRQGRHVVRTVDLNQLIAEVERILSHSVDKRIVLKTALCAAPSLIRGDASQLQGAILNLALNGCDAMPTGGTLTLETSIEALSEADCTKYVATALPGNFVRVRVSDTGNGMDAETRTRLFEPFFTTKSMATGPGTGMGLAAVFSATKSHRGALRVHSEPGAGSSIDLLIPLPAGRQLEALADRRPAARPSKRLEGARILVVDDDAFVRDASKLLLEGFGCQVTSVADGQAAVQFYATHQNEIDLVLLDLVMPALDGAGAFAQLRGVNPDVRVLIVSGYSSDISADSLLQEGYCAFVQKPYRRAELATQLERVLPARPKR